MRRALIAASLLCSVALPAQAADIAIAMDEVRTITFPEAVSTVYMGNPAIADVNMIDTRHAFLLGKGYGSTNMIAITKDGTQVANTHISVLSRGEATVVLNRTENAIRFGLRLGAVSAQAELPPRAIATYIVSPG